MPSPFPGMDPYLECYLWADVHNALASKIRQLLVPLLRPRYTARLEIYVVEDTSPEGEIGILYPDVEVVLRQPEAVERLPYPDSGVATTPALLRLPVMQPVTVRIPSVEIRDTAGNRLVTSIEILSPVNKREPGLAPYRQKRQRWYGAAVHLIELDLLRRGTRLFSHPRLPDVPYLVALTRAHASAVELWPIALQQPLPVIPVPLCEPDSDVALDLSKALSEIYDEAAYELSIDYGQPPPAPVFAAEDLDWMRTITPPPHGF